MENLKLKAEEYEILNNELRTFLSSKIEKKVVPNKTRYVFITDIGFYAGRIWVNFYTQRFSRGAKRHFDKLDLTPEEWEQI